MKLRVAHHYLFLKRNQESMALSLQGLVGHKALHPLDPLPSLVEKPESAGKEEEDTGGRGSPGGRGKFSLEGLVRRAPPTGWNSGWPRLGNLADLAVGESMA